MRKFHIFYANTYQHIPYGIPKDWNNGSELCCPKGACAIVKYTVPRHTCTYHKEEITRTLSYIYINWYYIWIELSGWMGSVSYGLGAELSLPPCLSVTIGIWTLAHKSDPRAEISGEIVWYDALAPRPEVLLSWYFTCACAMRQWSFNNSDPFLYSLYIFIMYYNSSNIFARARLV